MQEDGQKFPLTFSRNGLGNQLMGPIIGPRSFLKAKVFSPSWAAFVCNVCGVPNVAWRKKLTRETPSCRFCKSNVRFRSLVNALSQSLYGKSLPLPLFPSSRKIRGMGMSDWPGYATRFARKFDYVNTYYHQEPRLDITQLPKKWEAHFDFVISSDVFEHIVSPVSVAFENTLKALRPGGVFLLTVPFLPDGKTTEHFKSLHDFKIVEEGNKKRLRNITLAGDVEWFDDLVFHIGAGATLEMRLFTLPSLVSELGKAGFEEIKTFPFAIPAFGIPPLGPRSFPITARRPLK